MAKQTERTPSPDFAGQASSPTACQHLRPLTAPLAALATAAATLALALALSPAPATAATPAPHWKIHSFATPANFSTSDNAGCLASVGAEKPACDIYQVTARDAGSLAMDPASNVTLTDTVPAGMTVQKVSFYWSGAERIGFPDVNAGTDLAAKFGFCSSTPSPTTTLVICTLPTAEFFLPPLAPDETLEAVINVTVDEPAPASPATNTASVSGGGVPDASVTAPNQIGGSPAAFGFSSFAFDVTGPDGLADVRAGAHPYELTARIDLNGGFRVPPDTGNGSVANTSAQDLKDVIVDLPLGFLGGAQSTPQCTFAQLSSHISANGGGCPPNTVVGHINTEPSKADSVDGAIYNMVPEHGRPAEFAFVDALSGTHVLYASVAPTPAGYVLRTTTSDVPQIALTDISVTFFGNPAAKNAGSICGNGAEPKEVTCRQALSGSAVAMFTNPSDCSVGPLATAIHMDSWQKPGSYGADGTPNLSDPNWISAQSPTYPEGLSGCNLLQFDPTLHLQPETTVADSPTGVEVDLKLPQPTDPATLATPPLKRAVVTLPEGFTVNPSSAGGLGACSPAQIALQSASAPSCPDASKIGTVELTTPLLAGTLSGSVYLATQYDNPFHSLLAGYIVVADPDRGVVVKIPGNLTPDPQTGQISGVFDDNPQFPFSELKLHFKGGSRGALATPENCGTFTTTSQLSPWSAPDSGPAATPSDSFAIDTGCVNGFTPSFSAGTTATTAGAYAPFVLSFSRSDTDQQLAGLSVTLPPGLLAKIAGVSLCSDAALAAAANNPSGAAEAASPSCLQGSQLGSVQAGAGAGPTPFFAPGKAYLTGPYKGGPYGLAVVVPAIAGPFDLGNVVVRSSLRIDPQDGHVTAISDPLPTIIKGIPLRVRRVDVTLDRPAFTFNPTSCEPKAISATLSSTAGLTAVVSSRFQAGGCQELSFKPQFKASTQGHTSKANGASLTVTVAQKAGEANIAKVNLQLPLALPSRLTTLQKACLSATFEANPAACPQASNIGTATARTPALNVPLSGPAYLVSHGNAAFPDVEFVLQGEGVTIVLDGKTDIKKGITYSKFETVPDAPISSFVTTLPQGPHSALAANGNLCAPTKTVTVKKRVTRRINGRTRHVLRSVKQKVPAPLLMPTTITGQNGAVITQATKIAVTGCAKQVKHVKRKKAQGKKARRVG
jgi:uncharacterized repeat protein (TIGR01451 family)